MNISVEKRFLSLVLTFILVLSLIPASVIEVWADDLNTTVLDGKITVKTTDGTNKGTAQVDNGTITIGAKANTNSCTGSWTSAGTHEVTLTNETTSDITISFDYGVPSNGGTLTIGGVAQSGAGTHTVKLAASGTLTLILESGNNNKNESTVTLSNFQVIDSSAKTVVVKSGVNGTVKVNGTAITEDVNVTTDAVTGVGVEATAQSGYEFVAWVDADNNVLSSLASYTINPKTDLTVSALFVSKSDASGYWSAGGKLYTDLTTATQNVQSGDVIVLLKDYVLPAGEYTIPAGVTLQIPFNAAHTLCDAKPEILEDKNPYPALKAYRTLTMASGAKLIVNGTIEVSAKHIASHGGKFVGGRPYEYYGKIVMNESSEIQLNSGGTLYAWGYIIGSGKVTALPGSAVYEKMQVTDYLGGTGAGLVASKKIFPFSQYYVQNVEVEEVIHSGASLVVHAGVYASGINEAVLAFIGSGGSEAMFALSSGTATKYYDNATDRIILDVNGTVSLNPITFPFGGINYNSSDYVLPIGNNYTINVNSGSVTITQNIMLQPGTNINIAQGATVDVQSSVYVMDADNWGNYCFGVPMRPLLYVPTSGKAPVARSLQDAKIDVNGTIIVSGSGAVYTSAANAQIISTGETGSIQFERQAPSGTSVYRTTYAGGTYNPDKPEIPMSAAVLTNGNGSTVSTSGAAADTTYLYCGTHDYWAKDGCACCANGDHTWNAPTYTWSEDNSSCTATRKCANCATTETAPASVTSKVTKPATCAETGTIVYTAEFAVDWVTKQEKTVEVAKLPHTEVIDAAVAPTCTATGLTEGKHCFVCNEVLVAQTEVAALGHTEVIDAAVAPTCTVAGKTEGKHCSVCNEVLVAQTEVAALGHKDSTDTNHNCDACGEIIEECYDTTPKDHICDECGTELGKCSDGDDTDHNCDYCNKTIENCYDTTPKDHKCDECGGNVGTHADSSTDKDHVCDYCGGAVENGEACFDPETDGDHNCDVCGQEVSSHKYSSVTTAPTCTEKGYTTHTCNCGHTYKDTEVAALGHTEVIDAAVAATCTTAGKTEGKHCSVCNEVLVAQEEIQAIAHKNKEHHAKADATCVSTGTIEYWSCPDCKTNFSDEACTTAVTNLVIAKDSANHVNKTDHVEKSATCLEDGYTAGVFCEDCKTWISGHGVISAKGHTEEIIPAVEPTCTETGLTEGTKCSVCGTIITAQQTIPAKGHTEVIDAAKAPTCTETGLTEGKHCSVCDAVIVAQTEVKALGHTFGNITVAKVATCIAAGNEAYKQCSRCNLYFAGDAEINATDGKADTSAFVIGIDSNNHSNKKPHAETPATCLEVGYTAGTHCDDCNQWIFGHDMIPAIAHKNKVHHEKVDATCVKTGTIEYWSCPDCGKNFSDEACTTEAVDLTIDIDPDNHDLKTTAAKAPACEAIGWDEYVTCQREGCTHTTYVEKPATGHNMQQTAEAVAPTCTATGKTAVLTCANGCGKTEGGEEIPSTGHSGGEATCLEPKECTVCGASYGDKNPSNHVSNVFKYTNKGATHAKYYACCEALAQASEAHKHVEGKCVCGNTLSYTVYWNVNGAVAETDEGLSYGMTPAFDGKTPAKEHDANCHYTFAGWAASADGEVMATLPAVTKTVTYYAVFTAEAHTDAPADGNHNCDDCGRTNVSVHTYSDATCTAPATCTDCGVTTGEALGHIDVSPKDHKCDRECGEVNMGTHEAASGKHTCDYCSQPVTHCKDSLSLTSEISADCTTAGNHAYYTCSVCGMYYSDADATQAIAKDSWITPATGHAFEELGTVCTNGCEYTRAAKIGETSYETLDAAMEAAQTGDTIVALTKIVIEGDVTWDLTGKKLDVQYLDAENYALVVKGNLTIKGGEFNFANMYGIGVRQTGTLVIDGGKFTTSEDEYLIGSWGTTTINGGTFESVYCNVDGFKGTLTVNGGNFTVTGNDAEYPSSDIFAAEDVATIYGGTYSTDISEYLAPEYKVSQNAGRYVVEKCYHTTVTKVIDPAPTCTEDGLATYTCVDCQHEYTKALPATGHKDENKDNVCDVETCKKVLCTEDNHKYETIPGKAATCTATGLTEYPKCTACGHIPEQPTELPIVAHQGTWSEPIPATCENPGRLGYFQCTMCGGIFDSNQKALTSLVIPASGHDYVGEITQDPTCTEPGVKTFTCQNDASHTYTEPVSAKGHTYGTWITEVPATCTVNGVKAHYHCDACGADFDDDKNPLVDLVIPAKGHAYDAGVITTPPTCTEPGIKTFTCQNDASHTYTEAVEAKGHAYGEWIAEVPAKCTEDGTKGHYHCTACGVYFDAEQNILVSIVIPKAGHTPVIDPAVAPTCTEPGKTEGAHCSVCPAVLTPQVDIPALGHKDENTDHVCENGCDVYQGTHADSAEDKDHVCDYGCKAVLEDCSDATTDTDHDCDVCGKENVTDHDYKAVVTDPTCEADGYTTYTCNCTHTYTDDVVSALGHKDVNKDHVCDNGCGVYQGKHEDTDKDHKCDYGCTEAIGTCADSDHDHDCDYGCDKAYGTHEDTDKNHKCDYGCKKAIGTCADGNKDHYCDYGCGKYYGTHADSNGADDHDHNCDYCGTVMEACSDTTPKDHICDECGTELSKCSDSEDANHNCDYCGKKIEDCYDTNPKDHKCDECGATLSQCADSDDNDHNCDYCGKENIEGHTAGAAATCTTPQICTECGAELHAALGHKDDDKNHACDNGCDVKQGDHKDDNKDHKCDYGCKESIGTCEDADFDHDCDYGCGKNYGTHEDTDNDHACEYGCAESIGACEDADLDHVCDYGCDKAYGTHEDTDFDHKCDYGCKVAIGDCADTNKDHKCDYGCGKNYGTHEDTDKNHICDYGCDAAIGTCQDNNKDHKCDYGCDKEYGEHIDDNKDHACDYGCAVAIGTHADSAADKDHVCDYGCGAVLEECVDADKDHACDNGCDKYFGEHVDKNKDHACDYGCKESIGTCEDTDRDHDCDYGCDKYFGTHEDTDSDHACDYGCKVALGTCEDTDHDHDCDYGCDKYYGTHEDTDHDHNCDYGCAESIGTCEDTDHDHDCDYGCDKYFGEHVDTNYDHACDYGCSAAIGDHADSADDADHVCDHGCGAVLEECVDADKDHACDNGCDQYFGTHEDTDHDHACDYGCAESIGTCEDTDYDHACDYGCDAFHGDHEQGSGKHTCDYCGEVVTYCKDNFLHFPFIAATCTAPGQSEYYRCYVCAKYYSDAAATQEVEKNSWVIPATGHADANTDHVCDNECGKTNIGTHADDNTDHICDYGCSESIGTHADSATDNDHLCDYGCGEIMEACSDMTGDGDHICDYCGSSEVLTQCTGGTPVRENENPATVAEAGSYDSVVYCSECGEELSRDTIVIPQLLSQVETEEFTDSTIPETIKTNPNYNTVEKLADAMSDAVIAEVITESIRDNDLVSVKDVQTQLMDVTLQYSTDGETWQKADEEHFPDDGKIEIILPVPEGTKHSRYTYYVAHMFTSGAFGNTAGEMEYPEVDEIVVDGQECIRFYVTGLSPITVSYLETEPCADGHTHDSYGYDETNHWSICSICGETFAATPHTFENDACGCGAKRVKVVAMGQIQYTVSGQTVTVTHDTACRVGYLVNGKYKALPAIKVSENCYRFIAPADVEEVLLVAVADLDQDGDVDADDMDILSNGLKPKAHASYKPLDAWQQFAADVNNNGKLNAADLLLVARSQTGHEMYKALTW